MRKITYERNITIFFAVLSFVLVIPIILQMMNRPIGLMDYFTLWDLMGVPSTALYDNSQIVAMLCRIFLTSDFTYRPFSVLIFYICGRIVEGKFWIILLLKWTTKFFGTWILYKLANMLKVSGFMYCLAFSYLFFHIGLSELMPFSSDSLAGVFCAALIYLIYRNGKKHGSYCLSNYTKREYTVFLFTFGLASGMKEIVVVLLLTTVIFFLLISYTEKSWPVGRLLSLLAIVGFTVCRIIAVALSRMGNSGLPFQERLHLLKTASQYTFESGIAYGLISLVIAAITIFGGFYLYKYRDAQKREFWFFLYIAVSIMGMIVFTAISVNQMGTRYVIPISYLVAELLLVSGIMIKGRMKLIPLSAGILIPFFCLPSIYGQHLGYETCFEEQQLLLNYIEEEKAAQPELQLVLTGSDEVQERSFGGLELQRSIKEYFGPLGARWYGNPEYEMIDVSTYLSSGESVDALWMTTYEFENAETLIGPDYQISEVTIGQPKVETLSELHHFFTNLNMRLGITPWAVYDVGAYAVSDANTWNVFRITPVSKKNDTLSQRLETLKYENYTSSETFDVNVNQTVTVAKGSSARVSYDLSKDDHAYAGRYSIQGTLHLISGKITYGFSDDSGNMYAAETLSESGDYTLSLPYESSQIDKLILFFYIAQQDKDTVFSIENPYIRTSQYSIHYVRPDKLCGGFF